MDQLFIELREILSKGKGLINEYNQKISILKEEEARLIALKKELDYVSESLNARESACAKVENVVSIHAEGKKLHEQANLRIQEAVSSENKLKQASSITHQELDNKRELIRREELGLEKRKKSMDEEVSKRVQETLKRVGIQAEA